MQRTGHTSSAVRSYKRIGEKLRAVTSDVLTGNVRINNEPQVKEEKETIEVPIKHQGKPRKICSSSQGISFVGACNCTININYKQ